MKIKVIIAVSLLFCCKAFTKEKSMSNVIYLNGPSCSEKTTLAKELQEALAEPYLYLSIDQIAGLMPQKTDTTGELVYGPLREKICQTFKEMVSLLASEKYNLIIDSIAPELEKVEEWKELLKNYSTLYVGVQVPLEEAETKIDYDLKIDTHETTLEENIQKIRKALQEKDKNFQETKKPKSQFAVIYRTYLKPGMEEAYKKAWEKIATYFVEKRGAIGSCLHQASDGMWVAYSRWPDSQTRDASWPGSNAPSDELPLEIRQAIVDIRECLDLERKLPDICLDVVNDLLLVER